MGRGLREPKEREPRGHRTLVTAAWSLSLVLGSSQEAGQAVQPLQSKAGCAGTWLLRPKGFLGPWGSGVQRHSAHGQGTACPGRHGGGRSWPPLSEACREVFVHLPVP